MPGFAVNYGFYSAKQKNFMSRIGLNRYCSVLIFDSGKIFSTTVQTLEHVKPSETLHSMWLWGNINKAAPWHCFVLLCVFLLIGHTELLRSLLLSKVNTLPNVSVVGQVVAQSIKTMNGELKKGEMPSHLRDSALFCPHRRETETLLPNAHLAETEQRMKILPSPKWQMWWNVAQYECVPPYNSKGIKWQNLSLVGSRDKVQRLIWSEKNADKLLRDLYWRHFFLLLQDSRHVNWNQVKHAAWKINVKLNEKNI